MPWPKGRPLTQAHRRKLSRAHRGLRHATATRRQQSLTRETSMTAAVRPLPEVRRGK